MDACSVGCTFCEFGTKVSRERCTVSKVTRKRGAMERHKIVDCVVKVSRKRFTVLKVSRKGDSVLSRHHDNKYNIGVSF